MKQSSPEEQEFSSDSNRIGRLAALALGGLILLVIVALCCLGGGFLFGEAASRLGRTTPSPKADQETATAQPTFPSANPTPTLPGVSETVAPLPTPSRGVTPSPITPTRAPEATPTVEFISVTGAAPGGDASVTVQTMPAATCSIASTTHPAKELGTKSADARGRVSWSFAIPQGTKPGQHQVTVTCNGVSASAPIVIK